MMKIMKTSTWSMIFWAVAYMTAMGGGHAWADVWPGECSVTTVDHTSAYCLVAVISLEGKNLSTQNVCTDPGSHVVFGTVVAEISVRDSVVQPDGVITSSTEVYLKSHGNSDALSASLPPDSLSVYTQVGCCPSEGICDWTDCDTTDGVIDDRTHASHCFDINDSDGTIMHSGKEIEYGQLVDASSDQDAE